MITSCLLQQLSMHSPESVKANQWVGVRHLRESPIRAGASQCTSQKTMNIIGEQGSLSSGFLPFMSRNILYKIKAEKLSIESSLQNLELYLSAELRWESWDWNILFKRAFRLLGQWTRAHYPRFQETSRKHFELFFVGGVSCSTIFDYFSFTWFPSWRKYA